jgi:hypothetical protein
MTLSGKTNLCEEFDQQEYDNVFYCCEDGHPFVAFTLCYCPLCEHKTVVYGLNTNLERADTALDRLSDTHEQLVVKVYRTNPELLI